MDPVEFSADDFQAAYRLIPGAKGDPGPTGPAGPPGPGLVITRPAAYEAYVVTFGDPAPGWALFGFPGCPTLQTGVMQSGVAMGFRKEGPIVRFRGLLEFRDPVVPGASLFVVPTGFQPAGAAYFPAVMMVPGQPAGDPVTAARVKVDGATGNVTYSGGLTPTGPGPGETRLLIGMDGWAYVAP